MIHTPKTKTGLSKKLTHQWSGPYYINKVLSEIRYLLADSKGKPLKSPIHVNRLKVYTERSSRPSYEPPSEPSVVIPPRIVELDDLSFSSLSVSKRIQTIHN